MCWLLIMNKLIWRAYQGLRKGLLSVKDLYICCSEHWSRRGKKGRLKWSCLSFSSQLLWQTLWSVIWYLLDFVWLLCVSVLIRQDCVIWRTKPNLLKRVCGLRVEAHTPFEIWSIPSKTLATLWTPFTKNQSMVSLVCRSHIVLLKASQCT